MLFFAVFLLPSNAQVCLTPSLCLMRFHGSGNISGTIQTVNLDTQVCECTQRSASLSRPNCYLLTRWSNTSLTWAVECESVATSIYSCRNSKECEAQNLVVPALSVPTLLLRPLCVYRQCYAALRLATEDYVKANTENMNTDTLTHSDADKFGTLNGTSEFEWPAEAFPFQFADAMNTPSVPVSAFSIDPNQPGWVAACYLQMLVFGAIGVGITTMQCTRYSNAKDDERALPLLIEEDDTPRAIPKNAMLVSKSTNINS